MNDLELLRAYEPILRYTQGELFFPTSVEPYIAECDLWVGRSERERRLLVPYGELTTDRLAEFTTPPDETLSLRLVQRPLGGPDLARWSRRPNRPQFHASARLARVGLFARLVDAGFTTSLLVRGSVPGGTAAGASIKYEQARERDPRHVYHGRVVRGGGWIVLHYMYFYFMNDWRSTFSGANDHEADLEQAFVYLDDAPDGPQPIWFGCAAHDYHGDDLRRRWDDPALVKVGDHPVIHAGAGSHAAYFEQGEYVTTVPLPALRGLTGLLEAARAFWRDTLRQPDPGDLAASLESALSAPFIDYARGDGMSIGPGQSGEWSPVLIDDGTPWVDGYRGLFGLDTYDRLGGERAPAGPKYTRSGTVRQSWHDPLGFVGLDKVAPPSRAPQVLQDQVARLRDELHDVEAKIGERLAGLPGLELEVRSLAANGALARIHEARATELAAGEKELAGLRSRQADLSDTIEAAQREAAALAAGEAGDPRAHLRHSMHPVSHEQTRYGRFVEFWSAISISVLLLLIIVPLYTGLLPWWAAFALGIGGYVLLESAFRRRLTTLLLRLTLLLAILGAIVLLYEYAGLVVVAAIVGLAALILADNVRELRRV